MTRGTALLMGLALLLLPLLPGVVGAGLIVQAGALPEYSDDARAQALMNRRPPALGGAVGEGQAARSELRAATADWRSATEEMRTPKWDLLDLGRGLLMLSGCLLAAWLAARLWDVRNLVALRTPRSSGVLLLLLTGSWLWPVLAVPIRIVEEQDRFYNPVWADTAAIPIVGNTLFFALSLPVLLAVTWVAVRGRPLPGDMWAWRTGRPVVAAVEALATGAVTGILALFAWSAVTGGHHLLLPGILVLIYVALSVRAARVLPRPGLGSATALAQN